MDLRWLIAAMLTLLAAGSSPVAAQEPPAGSGLTAGATPPSHDSAPGAGKPKPDSALASEPSDTAELVAGLALVTAALAGASVLVPTSRLTRATRWR